LRFYNELASAIREYFHGPDSLEKSVRRTECPDSVRNRIIGIEKLVAMQRVTEPDRVSEILSFNFPDRHSPPLGGVSEVSAKEYMTEAAQCLRNDNAKRIANHN
jgi:hypothetical protein